MEEKPKQFSWTEVTDQNGQTQRVRTDQNKTNDMVHNMNADMQNGWARAANQAASAKDPTNGGASCVGYILGLLVGYILLGVFKAYFWLWRKAPMIAVSVTLIPICPFCVVFAPMMAYFPIWFRTLIDPAVINEHRRRIGTVTVVLFGATVVAFLAALGIIWSGQPAGMDYRTLIPAYHQVMAWFALPDHLPALIAWGVYLMVGPLTLLLCLLQQGITRAAPHKAAGNGYGWVNLLGLVDSFWPSHLWTWIQDALVIAGVVFLLVQGFLPFFSMSESAILNTLNQIVSWQGLLNTPVLVDLLPRLAVAGGLMLGMIYVWRWQSKFSPRH